MEYGNGCYIFSESGFSTLPSNFFTILHTPGIPLHTSSEKLLLTIPNASPPTEIGC